MKKIMLIAVAFIVIFSCSSCNVNEPKQEAYNLNSRQIKILEQEKLQTDYKELTLSQQIAIESIEDMYKYLDKQYPKETFEYVGYIQQSALENEQLLVSNKYGQVTVQRSITEDKLTYTDDFKETRASYKYCTDIDNYLSRTFDKGKYIVSVTVGRYNGDDFKSKSVLENSINTNITVFVKEEIGRQGFKNIVRSVSNYLKCSVNKNNSVSADYYLVKDSKFYNYTVKTDSINSNDFLLHKSY